MSRSKGFLRIFWRETKRIFTNRHLRLLCLIAPFSYAIVLSSIYYHKRIHGVSVGVVDLDNTKLSRTITRWADATENITITGRYQSFAEARRALEDDSIDGFIYIPRRFAADIKRGGDAKVFMAVNYGNVAVGNPALTSMSEVAGTLSAGLFSNLLKKHGIVRDRVWQLNQLVRADINPVANPEINYSDFMLPGLVFIILQQIILVGLAFTVADERAAGNGPFLHRLCGGHYGAMVLGKAAPYMLLNYIISVMFVYWLLPVFDLPMRSSVPVTLLFTGLFVTCATAFGLLLSSLFKDTVTAFVVLMFFSMPAFLISGVSWPYYNLPPFVRAVAAFIPSTHFMTTFRFMVGTPMDFSLIAGPSCALAVMAVCYFTAAWLILKRLYARIGF